MTRARDVATQGGLVLITKVNIGTSVTSLTINNCFSSEYDNYKVIGTGGTIANPGAVTLQLGSSTASYKYSLMYSNYGSAGVNLLTAGSTTVFGFVGIFTTENLNLDLDILNPFTTKKTTVAAFYLDNTANGLMTGFHDVAASYNGFKLDFGAAATGGTIYVYGYKKN